MVLDRCIRAVCLATGLISVPGVEASAAVETVSLKNGIKIVLAPIEDSTDINIITWIPMGLCDDAEGQAQWSHLLEHLVVSSTGEAPFDEINAETMHHGMHLDFSRPAEHWNEGVEHHAKWLTINDFAQKDVDREIQDVIAETENVARAGNSHKFAMAAWAQAVRYGRTHVEILGDVRKADPKRLIECYKERFFARGRPLVVVAGKFDRAALLAELEARLGKVELPESKKLQEAKPTAAAAPKRITWDLSQSHLIFYWLLPEKMDELQRSAVLLAAPAFMMTWRADTADYRPANSPVLVEEVRLDGRVCLMVNMVLAKSDEAAFAAARKDAEGHVERLTGNSLDFRNAGRMQLEMHHNQFNKVESTIQTAMRFVQQPPPGVRSARRMIEGNFALQLGLVEFRHDGKAQALVRRASQEDDEKICDFLEKALSVENRRELLIVPK